jgi:hypothetical protein
MNHMTHAPQKPIDVVLDLKNTGYQNELYALFRSLATNPAFSETGSTEEIISLASKIESKNCLYISDHVDTEKLEQIAARCAVNLDSLLLVDEDKKNISTETSPINHFNHVLSCAGQHIPHQRIMSTVRKIRDQTFFGVDKCVTYGAHVHRYLLSHSEQRQWFRESLFQFVHNLAPSINRSTDKFAQFAMAVQEELLVNAIWDANPNHRTADRRIPVALEAHETVQVEWCFDGVHLAIGVRDPLGSFDPTLAQRCREYLFAADRRTMARLQHAAGESNLGLFMILNNLSSFSVTVSPGSSSELVAILDPSVSHRMGPKRPRFFQYFAVKSTDTN